MPTTEYQASSVPFASLGRSILSIRRDQVHAVDGNLHDSALEQELESFQKQVADRFHELAAGDDVLSMAWICHLLDVFLCCQEEFRAILFNNRGALSRSPLDRHVSDFFDRAIKALDVCNAISDGVNQIRVWANHLDIVASALDTSHHHHPLGEGHFRRAKKALAELAILMLDEKDAGSTGVTAQRNRSFGRSSANTNAIAAGKAVGHFRSFSWSISRSWSAARQLQAIASNLAPPRNYDITATNGLAVPVFTMNSILLFVMWALVAAIPCQDRGLNAHFSMPRQFPWAGSIISIHERIMEESKKRERKNSSGLMREIHQIEKCVRNMTELADCFHFPLAEEREAEVRQGVEEVVQVCNAMKEGLDPLERQVREVFHRIVRSRTEGLDSLAKPNHPE